MTKLDGEHCVWNKVYPKYDKKKEENEKKLDELHRKNI